MKSLSMLILVAATSTIVAVPASQAATRSVVTSAIVLAQADGDVAAAEAAVEAARAAYREALVAGKERRVREARRALDSAVETLDAALTTAGLPPSDLARQIAMDEAAAAEQIVETARTELRDAMAKGRQSDVTRARKQLRRAVADRDAALAALGLEPGEEVDDVLVEETAPTEQAPAEAIVQEAPPAVQQALPAAPPAVQKALPAVPPPPPVAVQEPPQPPVPGQTGKRPPRFGAVEPGAKPVDLSKTEAAVKEGEEIKAEAGRVIVKEGGQVTIKHDDTQRLGEDGSQTEVAKARDGTTTTTLTRRNGTQVVTVRDRDGNILQRYRKDRNGSIQILIGEAAGNAGPKSPPPPPRAAVPSIALDFLKRLPPVVLNIPQQDYIVQSSGASQRQLEQALIAPPVEKVERAYSLEEIRRSGRLRDKVRRIDFDTVTFESGSAIVPPDQIPQMQRIGEAIQAIIQRDPGQVMLIEGHTDAAGSDLFNLALSDRRAETVAEILTYYYRVPPENLITQGYGEQFLKIPTVASERQNRRVAFRNITWLLRAAQ